MILDTLSVKITGPEAPAGYTENDPLLDDMLSGVQMEVEAVLRKYGYSNLAVQVDLR
jgi:hypothetical protein